MSKRLQVILEDDDYEDVQATAQRHGMTVSEWVRQSLRRARVRDRSDIPTRLAAIRAAVQHRFPAPPVEDMLDEIESGYLE